MLLVQQPPTRKIGSIADYDPLNDNYGSLGSGFRSAGGHRDVTNMYTGRFVHEFNTTVTYWQCTSLICNFQGVCVGGAECDNWSLLSARKSIKIVLFVFFNHCVF